jgi:hypothetical protein
MGDLTMTTRKSKSKKSTKAAKAAMTRGRRGASPSKDPLPSKIFANVSPRSVGGVSMFEGQNQIHAGTVANFFSSGEVIEAAVSRLQEAGFEILQISPLTINIAGTPAQYRRAFGANIVVEDRPVIKEGAVKDVAQFLDTPDTSLSGLIETENTPFADSIEGVALEEPRYYMAASQFAPLKSYWHLRMPGDVSLACNADKAHRAGITGRGIKVAMCDSGWFKHPYFVGRGYRAAPVVLGPAATLPLRDESGHGTGESANIFANAPDVDFMPVKMNFVNSTGAFNAAVGLGPNIITCSWGSDIPFPPLSAANQVLAAAIAAAVAAGIIVIFSAGNGHAGFPGQHPDVISAGGVFMNPNETLQASNYASGFLSQIYPGRKCPDVSGLVGMKPKAIYIMLPLEPGDQIDVGNAGGTHPNGDETTNKDGWGAFSGTSAAAPQLAGVAALIKQACPGLTPVQVRNIMMNTARDVTTGNANHVTGGPAGGHPATVGPDLATGHGLVDAHKAVMVAKVQCLGPIIVGPPIIGPPIVSPPIVGPPIVAPPVVGPPIVGPPIVGPTPITGPITPITGPVRPITGPVTPITGPVTPVAGPVRPITVQPVQPPRPIAPIVNPGPAQPGSAGMAGTGGGGEGPSQSALSAEDVETLSELIINSELDVD